MADETPIPDLTPLECFRRDMADLRKTEAQGVASQSELRRLLSIAESLIPEPDPVAPVEESPLIAVESDDADHPKKKSKK